MNSSTECAFLRAKHLLRKEGALTSAELTELDQIFDQVSDTQFLALMQDPRHQRALKQFDRRTGRIFRLVVLVLVATFVLSTVIGGYITLFK